MENDALAAEAALESDFDKAYEPHAVEARWYPVWLKRGDFRARDKGDPKKTFSIVIPPPNVTGSLHMGHGFNMTLQDIVVRTKRMQGFNTCWLPGTDHAGIATQMVVERQLEAEGTTRLALGREAFVKRVWEWKQQSGDRIVHQLQRLGCSCDWQRQRFTLDDGLSRAVTKVFVELYRQKLLYKDQRLVNWDPKLQTAISDLEVQQREIRGKLWHIKYPIAEQPGCFITVATTRPETLLGDTAVAVHPDDTRYTDLVGKHAVLPLVGRELPIVADTYSDPSKGTGAVKITPAHDFNDFEVGRRHQLEVINIFDATAHVNDAVPEAYRGLSREAARDRVLADLEAQGLIAQVDDQVMMMPYGDRSGVVLEPWLTEQWYVDAATLAGPAMQAVRRGKTRFFPKQWEQTYFQWLDNIRPWCVSRQLWWGHQIPAWYGPDGTVFVAESVAEAKTQAATHYGQAVELRRDPDVLDTWFSSALWPFSTFGWPDQGPALALFYPTSVLITGFDIIFFWVARMMMLGLHCMGQVPFHHVYIHALVRDPYGQKMSKSKGNVTDPLALMERYGTDAFRFTVAAMAAQGRDVRMSEERVEGYRHFCNKLWNAARFLVMQLTPGDAGILAADTEAGAIAAKSLSMADKWIQHRHAQVAREVTKAIEAYEFDRAAQQLYQFVWHEFCDWYLEASKSRLKATASEQRHATVKTLCTVFDGCLRLLHPFMPFITEELWQRLQVALRPGYSADPPAETLATNAWPDGSKRPVYAKEAKQFGLLTEVISAIRSIRSEHQIPPAQQIPVILRTEDAAAQQLLGTQGSYVRSLARLQRLEVRLTPVREGPCAVAVVGPIEVYVPLSGLIDIAAECERLYKEIGKLEKSLQGMTAQLGNADFIQRAPAEIVAAEQERQAQTQRELEKLRATVVRLQGPEGGAHVA